MNNAFLVFKEIQLLKEKYPAMDIPKLEFKFSKEEIDEGEIKKFKHTIARYGRKLAVHETDNDYWITMNTGEIK